MNVQRFITQCIQDLIYKIHKQNPQYSIENLEAYFANGESELRDVLKEELEHFDWYCKYKLPKNCQRSGK